MAGRTYTPEEKQAVLAYLAQSNWDVPLVSLERDIPERTLYRWKRQWQENNLSLPSSLPPLPEIFGVTQEQLEEAMRAHYVSGEFTELRFTLMEHIHNLTPTLSDDPDLAHRRVLALTRLLDRVIKLEELVRIERPQLNILKYIYPDESYHSIPYWDNELHNRADDAYNAVIEQAKREYYAEQGIDIDKFYEQMRSTEADWERMFEDESDDNSSGSPAENEGAANNLPQDDGAIANDSLPANPLPFDDGTLPKV